MLSSRRAFLSGLATLSLAGCGFSPVYGTNAAASALIGRVAYRAPNTPEGFRLRTRLEERLGRVEQGDYLLVVNMLIQEDAVVISSDQDTNRYNLPGTADWSLYPANEDTAVATGTARTFTAYSAFGTTVATQEAQDDARDRLAIALADLVITDLMVTAGTL